MGDQIGAGGFGEVFKAKWKGTEVALKVNYFSAHSTSFIDVTKLSLSSVIVRCWRQRM